MTGVIAVATSVPRSQIIGTTTAAATAAAAEIASVWIEIPLPLSFSAMPLVLAGLEEPWLPARLPSRAKIGARLTATPFVGREAETAQAAAACVRQRWPRYLPQPIFSSFKAEALAAARAAAPEIPRGFLFERLPADWQRHVSELGCATVHPNARTLTREEVAAMKGAGLKPDIHRYDAAHAFANERSEVYDVACANLAWERMLPFLASALK